MIRLATVFSGIGAPEEALKQLNEEFNIVFACDNGERELSATYEEIKEQIEELPYEEGLEFVNNLYLKTGKENYVKQSYFANNAIDETQWFEDVRFIDGTRYRGDVDILVGGSPCQSFSTYGKKQGFEDTRGTLFFHYASLIRDIHPKVFIYENVVGLMSHDKGNTWKRIQEIFKELDYDIYPTTLNAKDYGLPQIRQRVFVVGFDKALNIKDFKFPEPITLEKKATDYLSRAVDLKYYLGKKGFEWVTTKEKHQGRSRVNRDVICCQTANQQFNWTGDFRLEKPTDEIRADKRIYIGTYDGEERVARKLTPDECLRLMGFENFRIVVNDVNAYRQSGNSIAVPVLKFIFNSILDKVCFE
ncbi:MAG: DNA cytosine methyltransferase [Clostridia bacterium]|nr:DNA cytosine methyltransferase [Clostridia bacterium]